MSRTHLFSSLFTKIIALGVLSFGLYAQPITSDPTFKAIYADASNDKKLVLMLYTTTKCPQCAYMKKRVFNDSKVQHYLTQHFVILEKNIQHDTLPEGFDYFGVPTMFFINKQGRMVDKFVGSSRAEPFLQTLQTIVKKHR
jgi:thioredoxin-related protein